MLSLVFKSNYGRNDAKLPNGKYFVILIFSDKTLWSNNFLSLNKSASTCAVNENQSEFCKTEQRHLQN